VTQDILASRLRLVGVALVCAKVSLVPVVFDYSADFPFPVVKALVSHGLAYALAGVMAGLLVRFGRSLIVWSWIHVPVLAFLAMNILATAFAADVNVALFGTHARMLGLATVLDFGLLYFAIVLLVRTRAEATAVVLSALAGSVVVLAYGFVQLAGRDPFDWNIATTIRPFSTLGQTTTLGEYLAVLGAGALTLALFDNGLRRPTRAALGSYACLLLAGVVVTQTRSAFVGIAVASVLVIVLVWLGHPSARARAIGLAGGIVAVGVLTVVLFFTPLGARVLGTLEVPGTDATGGQSAPRLEQAADVRIGLYAAAVQMVRDRPILGFGPDNFAAAFPQYRSASEPSEIQQSLPTSAHGWPAQIAATSGLAGLASFIASAVLALIAVARGGPRPASWMAAAMLAAFLAAGLTTVSDVGVDWLVWASLAAIATMSGRPLAPVNSQETRRQQPTIDLDRGWTARRVVAWCSCAFGLLLALTIGTANDASRSIRDAQQHRAVGRVQQAILAAARAVGEDPRRPEYWDGLGLAYIAAQRTTDAIGAFDRAAGLAPYNATFLGDLASANLLLAQSGDSSAGGRAREVAERVVRADPNNPQAHLTRAVVMQVTGDMSAALDSVQRALALDPASTNAHLYTTATQVLLANSRPSEAISVARRAIAILGASQDAFQIYVDLARAFAALGQRAEAIATLDAALKIRPGDPEALQLRSQISASMATQ
jgi:O-antigen ligase/tetratricopeptide (TPR) repeat protein